MVSYEFVKGLPVITMAEGRQSRAADRQPGGRSNHAVDGAAVGEENTEKAPAAKP